MPGWKSLPISIGALALAMSAAACASSGARPRPFPSPAGSAGLSAPTPQVDAIVATALALRGRPYLKGGSTPTGFDCSGFTQYVFGRHGVALPREVREQFERGAPVTTGRVAPGDLLFFSTIAPGASHVGIAIGRGEFVHAPSSTGVVRVERLETSYWAQRFVGARHVN